ncbi:MAG: DNA repair protein RecO [Lachnospiraceae bacterium]|nr:DNA repair protein RecO [Lachnospiraceae bacterium]
MSDLTVLTGMVLSAMPIGDFDKRVVILTRERGKIAAFAKGARRQGSQLLGPSRPMAFGAFHLYEGRSSYTIRDAQITAYFDELSRDLECIGYGSYFLELSAAYTIEGLTGTPVLTLLYQSLRALMKPSIPRLLVRYIFELRLMVINGVYSLEAPFAVSDSTAYTIHYIGTAPLGKLYTFTVSEPVLAQLGQCMAVYRERYLEGHFTSLDILESLE